MEELFKSEGRKNWLKCASAIYFAREALLAGVDVEIQSFQLQILHSIQEANGEPCDKTCTTCDTQSVIDCPQKGLCQIRQGKCNFHLSPPMPCPRGICGTFVKEIQDKHRFGQPSWRNTDARKWCSNAWHVAKCYMPKEGYVDTDCAVNTDFNGIISVILNCKIFDNFVSSDLYDESSIYHQVFKGDFLSPNSSI